MRVTRKHWHLVHGPPLRTRSLDHLRTGTQSAPMDPSTDYLPNKIKNKNKDSLNACPIDRSLVWAKFRVLRWCMLGKCDRPGFSLGYKLCHCRSWHLYHFRCCAFAWKTGKPKKFVISFPLPFCLYLKFLVANCESWNEFTNPQENNRPKEMQSKQYKFRGFLEISQSFTST